MNITESTLIPGLAFVMAAGTFAASAQKAVPALPDDNGKTGTTAALTDTRGGSWTSLGIGRYRDNIMHVFRLINDWYPEWDVEIMQSETNPGLYKVVDAYGNCPYSGWGQANSDPQWCILIDATDPDGVMILDWYAGFDFTDPENGQAGPLMIWSQANDYYENIYGDLEQAKKEGLCGRLRNGAVTFPPGALLAQIAPDYETHYELWRPTNKGGMWRVKLPGAPDLDIDFTYNFSTDGIIGQLTTDVSVDKDVEKVLVAITADRDTEAVYNAMLAGDVETHTITSSGEYTYDITENGRYTVMMVPYYNGEALDPVYSQAEFIVADAGWATCSELGSWSDGFLYGIEGNWFTWYESTGNVEVQYSTTDPGVVRLVDPFGPDSYQYASSTNYDSSERHYMVFHINDSGRVYLDHMSSIGLDLDYGNMEVWCKAMCIKNNGASESEVEQWYGKLDGNEITFPKGGLYIKFSDVVDSWYGSNYQETFRVVLPDDALNAVGVNEVTIPDSARATELFTIQGTRVDSSSPAPGMYIRVTGGKVTKIMVR